MTNFLIYGATKIYSIGLKIFFFKFHTLNSQNIKFYPMFYVHFKIFTYNFQGAKKNGTAPDGTSYLDAAEKDEIKQLLR